MHKPDQRETIGIVSTFLQQYAQDRAEGRVLSIEDYQARFPGFEDVIAREFATLGDNDERTMDPAPDRAPRYRISEEIGRGGMGTVYRVWDRDLRRSLAMKVLLSDPTVGSESRDPHALGRFLQEAQVTGQLDHPGIVPVHELGLDENGRAFFTMSLIRGQNLQKIIEQVHDKDHEREEDWNLTRALGVVLRVCEAVAFAHDKGVVHRDLKPTNVMVGRFGETYVMDWGLARVVGEDEQRAPRLESRDSNANMTMDGEVFGTPAYMPPEQARGSSASIDARSDVYAIGAILYHLLSGRVPYDSGAGVDSSRAVLDRVLAGPPPRVESIVPSAPSELVAICDKAMARDPRDRYSTALDLAADLRAFLEQRVVRAHETGAWAEARKWYRRNRGLAVASALAVVALLSGIAVSLSLMARSDRHAARATAEFRDGEVMRGRLVGRSGELRVAEDLLWKHFLTSRSQDSLWALKELYQRRRCLASHDLGTPVDDVAFGPGDAWVVSVSRGGSLRVWEPKTLRVTRVLQRPGTRTVRDLDVSVDGVVATAGSDGSVALWNVEQSAPLRVIEDAADGESGDYVCAVRFSPDGRFLASAEVDGEVHLWDPRTGEHRRTFKAPPRSSLGTLCFAPDASRIAAASSDGGIRIWSLVDGACTTIRDPEQVERGRHDPRNLATLALAFTHGDRRIASGGYDRTLRVFDTVSKKRIAAIPLHAGAVQALELSPDGETLAIAASYRLELRDAETLGTKRQVMLNSAIAAAFSKSGKHLIAGESRVISLWETRNEGVMRIGGHKGRVASTTSRDGRLLATGDSSGRVRVFELPTGRELFELVCEHEDGTRRAHLRRVKALAFSDDARRLATGSLDGTARVWDLEQRACVRTIGDHDSSSVQSLQFGRGTRLLVVRPDGSFALVDAQSGQETGVLAGTGFQAINAAFHPDGDLIATTARDNRVRLWDARGEMLAAMSDDRAANWSLSFSHCGRYLANGCWHGHIELFDVERRERVSVLRTQTGLVGGVAFRPGSSRWFASASNDGTVRLWDRVEERCVMALDDFPGDAFSVSWGPGGKTIVASGADPNVYVWDLEHLERRVAGHLRRHVELFEEELGEAMDKPALFEWADRVLSR